MGNGDERMTEAGTACSGGSSMATCWIWCKERRLPRARRHGSGTILYPLHKDPARLRCFGNRRRGRRCDRDGRGGHNRSCRHTTRVVARPL
uniref:Uncharacterized protein n=1 Tax=Oryza rufipogon TaxID=4529 RepID=A0A679BBJ2_ORYRU|nr:hypothetical protein [Oryza rufipogon]